MKYAREENGAALIMVLAFSAVLLVLGGFLLNYATVENRIARNHEEENELFYTSEAGLEKGLGVLRRDFSFTGELTGQLGGREYRVQLKKEAPGKKRVVSSVEDHRPAMETELLVEANPFFRSTVVAGDTLQMTQSTVEGQLHYNCSLHAVEGVNFITEKVSRPAGADCFVEEGAELHRLKGEFREEEVVFPPVNAGYFDKFPLKEYFVLPGDITVREAFPADKVLVEGDLRIAPLAWEEFRWEGTLLVEGDLWLNPGWNQVIIEGTAAAEGGIMVNPGESLNREGEENTLRLLSGGNMYLDASGMEGKRLYNSDLLLYSRGRVNISGHENELKVRGRVFSGNTLEAEDLKISGKSSVWNREVEKLLGNRVVIKEWGQP